MKLTKISAAVMMIAAMAIVGALEAKTCKNYASVGAAIHSSKARAKLRARVNWRKKVKRKLGNSYANWTRSYLKNETCSRVSGKWRCIAKARACRP